MAAVNEKVMAMVQNELEKNPSISTQELFEKAKKLDKDVANLSRRQFNARYPLQIKRKATVTAGPRRRPRARRRGAEMHEAIRGILLQFAKDIAAAEGKADVVDVIGGVNKYVERVVKAAGR